MLGPLVLPLAPKTPEEPAEAPNRQRVDAAYTAKQAATAEVSKAEKAVQVGDKAKQQAKQRVLDLKTRLAAAEDLQVQAAADCTNTSNSTSPLPSIRESALSGAPTG